MNDALDSLHDMALFARVVAAGSFSAAARGLGLTPSAVSRQIARLEARLGVRLLERTTRHVRVTEAGQRYLDDARRIIAEIDEADEAAAGSNAAPRGHLSVTAPVLFGRQYVTPGIVDYLRRYPGMEVNAMFVDRVTNMMEEGIDVAVRIGELPDSSLRAVAVGQVRRVICASPAYLAEYGTPSTPEQLAHHTIVTSYASSTPPDWRFASAGRSLSLRFKPRLVVNSNDAAIEAVRRGFGITRLLSYQAAALLASGELCLILDDYATPGVPVNIVHRDSRQGSARIRSFVDLMAQRLRAEPILVPVSVSVP